MIKKIKKYLILLLFLLFLNTKYCNAIDSNSSDVSIGYFQSFINEITNDFQNVFNQSAVNVVNEESNVATNNSDNNVKLNNNNVNNSQNNEINFVDSVNAERNQNSAIKKKFSFEKMLYDNYVLMASDMQSNNNLINAEYFYRKAKKIQKTHIVSPSDPYIFGIIPDDIDQFLDARNRLKNVSIKSIMNSEDGIILADTYLSYDCWLSSFESGDYVKTKICRNRFLDNIRALEISLFNKGYNLQNNTILDNELKTKYSACETCNLLKQGKLCSAIYFEKDTAIISEKMSIVFSKIKNKILSVEMPVIIIGYYNIDKESNDSENKDKMNKNKNTKSLISNNNSQNNQAKSLLYNRLQSINNVLYSRIITQIFIQPDVKFVKINNSDNDRNVKYNNSFIICIKNIE